MKRSYRPTLESLEDRAVPSVVRPRSPEARAERAQLAEDRRQPAVATQDQGRSEEGGRIAESRRERQRGGTYAATGEPRPAATPEQVVRNREELAGILDPGYGVTAEERRATAGIEAAGPPSAPADAADVVFAGDAAARRAEPPGDRRTGSAASASGGYATPSGPEQPPRGGTNGNGTWEYLRRSGAQVLLGNYAGGTTALGTAGQVALGFTGLDVAADARDLYHDLTHWEWSANHIGRTALDGIGFLPVIGALKYADEAGEVVQGLRRGTREAVEGAARTYPLDIEPAKQGRHVPGDPRFDPQRSRLTYPDPRDLLNRFGGKGTPVGDVPRGQPGYKERVDFGRVIGEYVDGETGLAVPTTKGIIHHSKDGAHIVPARP